ncbi:hypothetical protein CMI39_00515 [Candidatus Pacearchaeota archaeon]|nr:hypothetical protein [Candidatus Pacearchaeota archaeon]
MIQKKKWIINKKLLLIIVIIILFGSLIYFYINKDVNEPNECQTDSDCIKVQTTCCSCNSGGKEMCVSKKEVGFYERQLENCSKNSVCIALYACDIKSCGCIEGKCV